MTPEEIKAQEIANFRFGLIAPIVSRSDLAPGEQRQLLEEIASRSYDIPYSSKTTVSIRTLERYLAAYRKYGLDGLKPSTSGPRNARIPEEYIQKAIQLRRENPRRSIDRIIYMLETSGEVPRGILKRSTLYDHFAKAGLTRVARAAKKQKYHRFGARHRNERWQGDTCHLLYLPDPQDPKRKRKTYLVAWIDDYSRLVVHGQIYYHERLPMLEDSLKKAVIRYGIPEQIYVDNAKIYSSLHFETICGRLGIYLTHSRPYRPQGRGKIEKFFQLVETSFVSEALPLIETGEITALDELNEYFWAWLKCYYHERVHSATKQKPLLRYESDTKEQRFKPLDEILDAFLLEETRKVDKSCVFQLNGSLYEADSRLAGCKVSVRYDPYDPKEIQVWYEGKRYANARPLEIYEHVPRNETPDSPEEVKPSGLNFLSMLKIEDEKRKMKMRMDFDKLQRKEGEKA